MFPPLSSGCIECVEGWFEPDRNHLPLQYCRCSGAAESSSRFLFPISKDNCPIPHVNMLRKPQCHFGWDWNIAIAPFGLYGNIELCRRAMLRASKHVQVIQLHRR